MSVKIQDLIPANFVAPPLHSASAHVLRRRKVDILANSQVTYSFSGNNRIEFNIQSPSDFLSTMDSYIRFELRTYGLLATGIVDYRRALATGGAHALFKSMELRLPSGVSLELISEYAKYYAANSYATQPRQYVDLCEGPAGDSASIKPEERNPFTRKLSGTVALTVATGVLAGTSTAFDTQLAPNDEIQIVEALTGRVLLQATVSVVTSATAATLDKVGITVGAGSLIYARELPARVAVCNVAHSATLATTGVLVDMKPMLQLLSMREMLPLFLMKGGVQLVMELANPAYAMINQPTAVAPVATNSLDYSIVNPRFIAEFVQPSEDIVKQYISLFNEDRLSYGFLSSRHYLNTQDGSASDISINNTVNLRSLRYALMVCENNRSNTVVASTSRASNSYIYDSVGTFIDGKITSYQFSSGSEQFPLIKVDCSDEALAEAFVEMQKTFGTFGGTVYAPRFESREWRKKNQNSQTEAVGNVSDQSHRFIMSTRFDRAGFLTGYDSSIGSMNVLLETSAANTVLAADSTRYIHSWFVGDSILNIGSSGISVRK